MKYELIQTINGTQICTTLTPTNLVAAMSVRGFELDKTWEPPATLREELQGQPKFRHVFGPLYGGPGVVRYEDWNTVIAMVA